MLAESVIRQVDGFVRTRAVDQGSERTSRFTDLPSTRIAQTESD